MMSCAVVTGATSGIGLEIARQLASMGYDIVVVSNQPQQNEQVVQRLTEEYGIRAAAIYADLTQSDAAEHIYNSVARLAWRVDVFVSNAGMLLFSTLEHTPKEDVERIIALHCTTPTLLSRRYAADMHRQGGGYILIVSSITAYMPYPTISLYAATKSYLHSLARSLWYEMHDKGVGVTVLLPSAVDTPLYNLDEKVRRRLIRCGLMLTPTEVAERGVTALFKRRHKCLPGVLTKLITLIVKLLPACTLLPIMKLPAVRRILSRL